jgi:hypothetical protein
MLGVLDSDFPLTVGAGLRGVTGFPGAEMFGLSGIAGLPEREVTETGIVDVTSDADEC